MSGSMLRSFIRRIGVCRLITAYFLILTIVWFHSISYSFVYLSEVTSSHANATRDTRDSSSRIVSNLTSLQQTLRIVFSTPSDVQRSSGKENKRHHQDSQTLKRILFWTGYFDKPDFEFGFGQEPFIRAGCRHTNCYATNDRSWLDRSDALLFHAHDYDHKDLPPYRFDKQRYVFVNYEPIVNVADEPIFAESSSHYFNWTMTVSNMRAYQPYILHSHIII